MAEQNNEKLVYLIEKIWIDNMENKTSAAVGYESYGFIPNEEEAKRFCDKSRQYTREDCWVISSTLPEYRYKSLKQIK